MAVSKNSEAKEAVKTTANQKPVEAPVQASEKKIESAEDRKKLIEEKFVPETVAFMKTNFGLDLYDRKQCDENFVHDLAAGYVTAVKEIVVTPRAYDRDEKVQVDMPKVMSYNALQVHFPVDENYKPVAPTKENPIKAFTYPCYEYVQKAYGSNLETANDEPEITEKEVQEDKKLPKFTNSQIKALEGIGIDPDRLFLTGNKAEDRAKDAFSVAMKTRILSGKEFNYHGVIKTAEGAVRVNGSGVLKTDENGNAMAFLTPVYEHKQKNNEVLDLTTVKRVGKYELDIFQKDANNNPVKDGQGRYQLTQEARDLALYGRTFAPMTAFKHTSDGTGKDKVFKTEKVMVFAAVVAGGVVLKNAQKVLEKDQDGNQIMVNRNGKEVEKFHYEAYAKVCKDGSVNELGQNVKFRSENDLEGFKRGRGGMVEGFEMKNKEGKVEKVNVWMYPDITKGGFASHFKPKASENLDKRFNEGKSQEQAQSHSNTTKRVAKFGL